MSGDAGYTDQEAPILEKMIMDSRCEKTKSESWARDEITRLREENARLREAVKNAYYEGWQDNASIDDTEDRLHAEWEFSEACAAIREGGND